GWLLGRFRGREKTTSCGERSRGVPTASKPAAPRGRRETPTLKEDPGEDGSRSSRFPAAARSRLCFRLVFGVEQLRG
ncbi:unnamed protein product, partial [Musa textilis]